MEMTVTFPGGLRVNGEFNGFTVPTDQPVKGGGEGSAPSPFALFLASLGTCAGFYVVNFCRARNLSPEGIRVTQRTIADPETHMVSTIEIRIHVPPSFPEKYHAALVRAAEQCTVKKHLEKPPVIETMTVVEG